VIVGQLHVAFIVFLYLIQRILFEEAKTLNKYINT